MYYTVTSPWLFKKVFYPSLVWEKEQEEKVLYLTFDDGPHPGATPFVLDQLKQYNAKATFFCIGKNVASHQDIYERLLAEGHRTGNHTFDHLNGWKTDPGRYIENVERASAYIYSDLFRPPYGRITKFEAAVLQKKNVLPGRPMNSDFPPFSIIMWTVLSGDFDPRIAPERCLSNVVKHAGPGSIVVFHDSTKAWERMSFALPRALEYFTEQGYVFQSL